MEFLSWVETLPFCIWIRESGSMWAYPAFLFLHTLGLGMVVGLNSAIDLHILGFAPRVPVAPLEKFFPYMWWGFWINAASGFVLLMADATTKVISPVFYVKMGCIFLAVLTFYMMRKQVFRTPEIVPTSGKVLAALSLVLWTGAVTAGRLMAYLGPVAGAPGYTNHL